jgi:hypothetical protein
LDTFLQDLLAFPEPITSTEIVINTCVAFVLGLYVTWVYRATHRQVSHSYSFVNTLMLLCLIMTIVMMVIGSNLARAFGLVGAMSVIRFRTVVKDTRDTAFVFLALGVGMATGTGNLRIALIGTILVGLLILLLHWTRHGIPPRGDFLLRFNMVPSDDPDASTIYEPVFKRYLSRWTLVNVKSVRMGQFLQFLFHVKMQNPSRMEDLTLALMGLEGLDKVSVTTEEKAGEV